MSAFYNENNPKMAAWLRELIKADLIAPGVVDERSITEIEPDELTGFIQCHFFAGIGGWSLALRLAGWPDDKEVWTGSCPCQPFSQAGKRQVDQDERNLWPAFRKLIAERKPSVVFGEQVASADGRIWLAGVRADVEALGYVLGAADLCAAGVSAPIVSQRLHWVAEAQGGRRKQERENARWQCEGDSAQGRPSGHHASNPSGSRMAETNGYHGHWWSGPLQVGWNCFEGEIERGSRKYRAQWRIKPGLSLLADGVPGRVAQLCGFGNAIVPYLAAEFIKAYLETNL